MRAVLSVRSALRLVLLPVVVPYWILRPLAMIAVMIVGGLVEGVLTLGRKRPAPPDGEIETFADRHPGLESILSNGLVILVFAFLAA